MPDSSQISQFGQEIKSPSSTTKQQFRFLETTTTCLRGRGNRVHNLHQQKSLETTLFPQSPLLVSHDIPLISHFGAAILGDQLAPLQFHRRQTCDFVSYKFSTIGFLELEYDDATVIS